MAREEHGVSYYVTGYARDAVHFPNGEVCCAYCPSCNKNDKDAYKCMRLGGQCMSTLSAKTGILCNCPLEFETVAQEANDELRR